MSGSTTPVLGESEMARAIRAMDWAGTTLGETAIWPPALLNVVNLILAAPIPMQLFWGADLVCIYNDAMAPALSGKHPWSLGQSARAVWAEAWSTIGPQIEQVLTTGEAVRFDDIFLPLLGDGELIDQYWTYSYSPVFDEYGTVTGVLDVAQNTTDAVLAKKRLTDANKALQRSEERFSLLIDRASVGINIGDSSGRLSYINTALLKILGYTLEEVRNGSVRWDDLTPPQFAEADKIALQQLSATGVAIPYEKSYRAKDGRLVPVQLGAVLIPSLSPQSTEDDIAVFFTNLTDQKKAEALLLQSGKINAVGKLASAISHEINNPLEAVTNVLYIVRNLPDLPREAKDYLEVADRELSRVSHVAAQTLRFHRLSTAAIRIAPDQLMEEVVDLYATRLKNYGISVQRDYVANISFECFEADIRQVLNNVFANAVAELGNGGKITIRTRQATRWSIGTRGVLITIADNGAGILREARETLFDAFFTTKGIHATGLGLWISCRIVHKHRGYMRARNRFCGTRGAVLQVWLPKVLAPSAKEPWHATGDEIALA